MGYMPGDLTTRAGKYLLSILKKQRRIRYGSHFFDGTEATSKALRIALRFDGDDQKKWVHCSPELAIAAAVDYFVKQGIVLRCELPDKLADGNDDYEIVLTKKGAVVMATTNEIRIPDMNL